MGILYAEALPLDDVVSHEFSFWMVVAAAVALGGVVALLLRYPSLRRGGLSKGRSLRWRSCLIAAGAIIVPISGFAYGDHWTRFFAIEKSADRVTLTYHYPDRHVEILRSQIVSVGRRMVLTKGERSWSVVLMRDDGHHFVSTPLRAEACNVLTVELQAWSGVPAPK